MAFINEKILKQSTTDIVASSFLNYSMSVIAARALPDVRDGLKPVHRRIAYGMSELSNTPDKPHKKSARIVGDVMGKFHPHGDSSIYEAIVRLSQKFSVRHTLVDMHGNNGSRDGDGAAAMRYTESRMTKLMTELLLDINKDTVDFQDNYDNTQKEPTVLPANFPNLLVNGTEGIAVGMATKIPPHNLGEVIDATIAQIDNPEITVDELMHYIKGPDFPVGCEIYGLDGIKSAYETGRGKITIRSKIDIVEKKGKFKLIIREMPYQVSPQKTVEKIAELQSAYNEFLSEKKKGKNVKEKNLMDFLVFDGINNYTDRSNDYDVHIEIDLKKGVNPDIVKEYLYKNTPLESTYAINNVALVPVIDKKGEERLKPELLSLKSILDEYIKHRVSVTVRRTKFEIQKAETRKHSLSGIIAALDNIDETVRIIRFSKDNEEAISKLIDFLSIDETQANSILETKLSRLVSMNQDKLRDEYASLVELLKELNTLLGSDELIREDIKNDLLRVKNTYADDRRSVILGNLDDFNKEAFISDDDMVITITKRGLIKRTAESAYRTQRRKGIGVNGMKIIEDDFIDQLHIAKNKDTLLFFTNSGKAYRKRVYDIIENNANSKGQHIRAFLNLEDKEEIAAIISVREFSDEQFLLFGTKNGIVKKTPLSDYSKIRQNGLTAIKFKGDDELIGAKLTSGDKNITLVSKKGISITFKEEEVKVSSRNTSGVKGIDLKDDDHIVSFVVQEEGSDLLVATNSGFGKRTSLEDFRVQNRGGKGMICIKLTEKNGEVIGCSVVQNDDNVMFMTKNGTLIKLKVSEIAQVARNAQGYRLITLRDGDILQTISRIPEDEEDELLAEEDKA